MMHENMLELHDCEAKLQVRQAQVKVMKIKHSCGHKGSCNQCLIMAWLKALGCPDAHNVGLQVAHLLALPWAARPDRRSSR